MCVDLTRADYDSSEGKWPFLPRRVLFPPAPHRQPSSKGMGHSENWFLLALSAPAEKICTGCCFMCGDTIDSHIDILNSEEPLNDRFRGLKVEFMKFTKLCASLEDKISCLKLKHAKSKK